MSAYIHDILEQPEALRRTLENLSVIGAMPPIRQKLRDSSYRQVILTGMGSSFHVQHPLHQRLLNAGIPAVMIETSELIHHLPALLQPGNLFVVVSQSGRSVEITRLLELLPPGTDIIAVTNEMDSPLASEARVATITQAGTEAAVSCKTYITILAALYWVGDALLGMGPEYFKELDSLPAALDAYLLHMPDHIKELMTLFKGNRSYYLAGRGASLAAVGTGGLITKEAALHPAEGMSAAAFRHGPFEVAAEDVFLLVFEGQPPTQEFNRQLVTDFGNAGGKAALASPHALQGVFKLPDVPAFALPLVEILPAQMISVALAELKGHEPGVFQFNQKVTVVE